MGSLPLEIENTLEDLVMSEFHKNNEINIINGVTPSKSDLYSALSNYFPYNSMRLTQNQIINSIFDITSDPHFTPLMIQANTGTGKTIAVLSALLSIREPGDRILIFVRTINQINPILREWQKIVAYLVSKNKTSEIPSVLPILGKNQLCSLNHKITSNTIINCKSKSKARLRSNQLLLKRRLMRLRRKNKRFRLLKLINQGLVVEPNVSGYLHTLQQFENCPYENVVSIADDADILVATYGYLINHRMSYFTDLLHLVPSKSLVLLDEAHFLAHLYPVSVERRSLLQLIKLYKRDNSYLNFLINQMRGIRILDINKTIANDKSLLTNYNSFWKHLRKMMTKLLDKLVKNKKLQDLGSIQNAITEVIRFCNTSLSNPNLTCIVTNEKMTFHNINPSNILSQLKNSKFLILQSATMHPQFLYRRFYGLPENTKLLDLEEHDIRNIRRKKNEFRAYYSGPLTSKSLYRNSNLYRQYALAIIYLTTNIPGHSLVLCPSYKFITEMGKYLPSQIVISETEDTTAEVLNKEIFAQTSPTIILGNQRGKLVEGNEWVTNTGRSLVPLVIFAGLSTPVPLQEAELLAKIKTKYLGNREYASYLEFDIPLYNIAKQAFGRTIRNSNDKGAIIFLDYRVERYLRRSLWLSKYSRLEDIRNDITTFFANYEVKMT